MRLQIIYIYNNDLTLNSLQWLICHNTEHNRTKSNQIIYIIREYLKPYNFVKIICIKNCWTAKVRLFIYFFFALVEARV